MRANAAGSSVALPVPSEAPTAARVAGRPTLRAVGVVAQVALVLVLVRLFRIEEPYGFVRLAPLIFGGFVLHAVLPLRWRLPCFLALSLTAVLVLFRWPHGPGLVAIGLALVAICHLPLPFIARLGLLAVVGAALAAIRAGWIETPWSALPTLVLPVLASMFMFRLIVYLYDLRHERERASLWTRLSYFFLLPNVCFLLFPVVDYRTFRRTYYDAPALEIYQKGALWMLRGITHLLAYRLVYYHLTLAPGEVHDLGGLLQFTVSTYLLYLRISGQFHLVIGILCLFGFNLPETHRLYYLAASFNDFWRRINIYWKDFMMKIFYYPAFMQLRTAGLVAGVAVATVVVFLTTWLLHSYQWFWLQGTFPVTAQDGLFWGILGLLVVVNSIREMRQGRSRTLARPAWSTPRAFRHAASVIGMFLFMAVLWSLWSTSSVSDWLATVAAARTIDARTVGLLVAAGALLVAGGVAIQFLLHRGWEPTLVGSHPSFERSAAYTFAMGLLLLVVGLPDVQAAFKARHVTVLASLTETGLNARDEARLERGYYEGLLEADRYVSALSVVQAGGDDWKPIWETGMVTRRDDLLQYELQPSFRGAFKGARLVTNTWGMRDQEYARDKPPATYRIGLLGASYEMGTGVEQEESFEAIVEDRLNRHDVAPPLRRFEILNFSVAGYSLLQNARLAEQKVAAFEPDLLVFALPPNAARRAVDTLVQAVHAGADLGDAELLAIVRAAGLAEGQTEEQMRARLEPRAEDLLRWGFRRSAEAGRRLGVPAAWLYVPQTTASGDESRRAEQRLRIVAEEAGFVTLSLEGAYGDADLSEIRVADWDEHPNAKGHRLLADRLHAELHERAAALGIPLSAGSAGDTTNP